MLGVVFIANAGKSPIWMLLEIYAFFGGAFALIRRFTLKRKFGVCKKCIKEKKYPKK